MSSLREREITCVHVCGPSHDHCVSLTCRRADVHGRAGDAGALVEERTYPVARKMSTVYMPRTRRGGVPDGV